jgi:hypothetical protein
LFDIIVGELIHGQTKILLWLGLFIGSQLINAKVKVMIDDGYVVFGEHNIEFDHLGASIVRLTKRVYGIFDEAFFFLGGVE